MSARIIWIMLACTLLCSSCAKTHGVSLGSTSEQDVVDAGEVDAGEVDAGDDDDESHDEGHRDGEDEEDERPFWLEPFESEPETTPNSLPSR